MHQASMKRQNQQGLLASTSKATTHPIGLDDNHSIENSEYLSASA
jgi:hypothetical protein